MARGSNGGIGGSGVFGLIGTTVQCKSDDRGAYCTFAKLVNILMWILIIGFLGKFALDYMKKK
jgi:hypothetical protein